MKSKTILSLVLAALSISSAFAETGKFVRWTEKEDQRSDLQWVVQRVSQKTGLGLSESQFLLLEDRALATSRFRMYAQVSNGLPIHGMSIRIWSDLRSDAAIQVEAQVDQVSPTIESLGELFTLNEPSSLTASGASSSETSTAKLREIFPLAQSLELARQAAARLKEDLKPALLTLRKVIDGWKNNDLIREVTLQGKRGRYQIEISLTRGKVVRAEFIEHPTGETSLQAQVYPIYEEAEGTPGVLSRIPAELKYISTEIPSTELDPYSPLRTRKYFEDQIDSLLGETEQGRAQGYWASSYLRREAKRLLSELPTVSNSVDSGKGMVLSGRYATINLHPEAVRKWAGQMEFTSSYSPNLQFLWQPSEHNGKEVYEMTPQGSYWSRPLRSLEESTTRPARRLPDHNPVAYLNDGFDDLQVYYAINSLFDSLRSMGWTDPELSTRPFHAFLYDPDIQMRDNAYYTDDTINFTTYSPSANNYARDNSTIWHELGHGIMDRMMGDHLQLADTGGLSEGMADFLAQLVVTDVMHNQAFPGSDQFRIINQIGFHLTNEVHDDGESYGGAMRDLLMAAIQADPAHGLHQVTDLVFEAMRLARNHPHLTAENWFDLMRFADERGTPGIREPGQLAQPIQAALDGRNFAQNSEPAQFVLKNGEVDLDAGAPGTRERPIRVKLKEVETAKFQLTASFKPSEKYSPNYPIQVSASFRGGPLQGAVHWNGEESGPILNTLQDPASSVTLNLEVSGKCDSINREDGSCSDFVYVLLKRPGEEKPFAKKRFYVRVTPVQ
jgi:hypothetical protein